MATTMKYGRRAWSVSGGLAISGAVSMTITLVLSLILAGFLDAEKITWDQAGYWIMGMLLTASFVGGKCAVLAIKRQRLLVSMMAGALYWGMLLSLTALFFGGKFSSVCETAGIILAGSGSAALIMMPINKNTGRKARKGYR